jgi:hypothetical protein
MLTARRIEDPCAVHRRVRIFGRLGIAREHGAPGEARQVARVVRQVEMGEDPVRVRLDA